MGSRCSCRVSSHLVSQLSNKTILFPSLATVPEYPPRSNLRAQAITVGGMAVKTWTGWVQGICSQEAEINQCCSLSDFLSSLIQPRLVAYRTVPATFRVGPAFSVKLPTCLHRLVPRCLQVKLNPVKPTVKINHPRLLVDFFVN